MNQKFLLLVFMMIFSSVTWSEDYVSGVSTEAISMPSLPGTVEGLPATINETGAKGQFSFIIDIKAPKGVNDHHPGLKLSYSSGDGQGEFGLGWSLNLESISLDTKRGVPTYSDADIFWGPDGELVRIEKESANKFFSPYINKKQNLYEYDDSQKSWILYQGDGKKLYFGTEDSSIVENEGKIFKWFVERIQDSVGNEITFHYTKIDGYPYLTEVKYAYKDGAPHYLIQFQYEDREDVLYSFKSTYEVKREKRCSGIEVKSESGHIIRSYELIYVNQKKSVLSEIREHGEGGLDLSPPRPPLRFEYSTLDLNQNYKTLKIDINDPLSLPPSLNKGRVTMVDINRDSFPDVLESSRSGAKVWINNGQGGLHQHYRIPEFISVLGEGQTKLLDVDGDRVVDFVTTGLHPKYFKGGVSTSVGELGFSASPLEITSMPRYSIGASNVKTIDINADGRLDIIAREVDNFKSFLSTSSGNWNRARDFVVNTGAFDLSSPYTFFADMNGDGLVDLTFVRESTVIYLPNKGTGEFAEPVQMSFEEMNPLILKLFKIGKYNFVIDVNGDGYSDLVNATESTLALSLNHGDGSFAETLHLTEIHEEDFDVKGFHVTTADMNGNHSTDLVWTNDFGDWRYLDFSSGLLNLLNKVDNGLGLKTHVEYAYATSFGNHGEALATVLPYPIPVVKVIYETLGNSSTDIRRDQYKYFGGYYDAYENDFRGFHLVEKIEEGDSSVDSLYSQSFYEQGRESLKDHQQLLPLKKFDFEYDHISNSIGHLLKGEEYTLTTLPTFVGNGLKNPGMPFVSETVVTEGDFEGNTRQHKFIRSITLNQEGFIEKDKNTTYLDLAQVLRHDEQTLAVANAENVHIKNRVCEKSTYDASNVLMARERFYYDNEPNLCVLTSGLLTKKDSWTGSSFETKNTYTYYSFGSLASFSDSFNHTTTVGYDGLNINPTNVTNAEGHVKSASYHPDNGMMIGLTDENNLTTSIYYDLYLRPTKIVGAADSFILPTTEAIYEFGNSVGSASSLIIKKREKSGQIGTFDTKEYFDGKGRSLFKISEGPVNKFILEGSTYNRRQEKHLIYQKSFTDSFSFPASMSGVRYFENRYDSLKRTVLTFNPEHESSDPSYKEFFHLVGETITYDEERKVSYEYEDALGRRVGHKDALQNEVIYTFDPLDQMVKITDPQGSETIFGFDNQKRKICKLDPTVGLTRYSYNSESLVTQKDMYGHVSGHSSCSVPVGVTPRTVNFEYNDGLNRLTKINFPNGSGTEDILNSYDETVSTYPVGKLTSVNFGVGSKKFDYDIYGNKSKTTLAIGASSYVTEKIFDALGRVEKIIYPTLGLNVLSIKYEFDEGANLKTVKDDSSSYLYVDSLTHTPLNQIQEGVFGNNTKFTLSYDESRQSYRLTNMIVEKIGTPNVTLQEIVYEYDKVSNIKERNDIKNSFLEDYTYDDLHRLTLADLGGVVKNWFFDEVGNITSNNGTGYSYQTSRKQVVASVGGSSYSFDAFGNISQDANRVYSFDWNNRLRSVTKSLQTTSYDYGEDGLRVMKTTPSETTVFIDKYTELRGSDVVRHIYANDKLIASIDELNDITYNHSDHLGSSNLKTDSSGNVVKRIEYLPFGDKRLQSGSYNNIKNRFTGQYEDEESDLYYYQQRYYDPVLSRFISADPLYSEEMDKRGMDSQELNLYAYVRNNPLKYIDPSGNISYLVSRDAIIERSPYSHNYIAVVQVPLKPEISSFGQAKDGTLQNVSNNKTISTHAKDMASWEAGNAPYEIIDATDEETRSATEKVSNILETAKIDYRYPLGIVKTYNSNTAAQAVANTAQGSDVAAPSSSRLGPVGSENSSDISGPDHEN